MTDALIIRLISKERERGASYSQSSSTQILNDLERSWNVRIHEYYSERMDDLGEKSRSNDSDFDDSIYICKAFNARVTQQLPPVRRFHASRNGAPDDTGRRMEDYRVFVKRFATASFPWRNAKCIPLLCKPRLPASSRHERSRPR